MEKHITDQRTGLTYELVGDYYLIAGDDEPEIQIGVWGQRRADYLRRYQKGTYTGMVLSGKLTEHLQEIDKQAEGVFERLITEYAQQEGVTEKLKAENQMEWVQRMNGIRELVTEIVNRELIYN